MKDLEKNKELYKLSLEVFREEEARFYSLEEKALRWLTALTLLFAIYGFIAKWLFDKIDKLVIHNTFYHFLIITLGIVLFFLFVFSWLFTFLSLQIQGRKSIPLNEEIINCFKEKELKDVFETIINSNKKALDENLKKTQSKLKYMKISYRLILNSVILFINLMFIVLLYLSSFEYLIPIMITTLSLMAIVWVWANFK